MRPVLCGNIKGLHDPYRNPTTQEGFARRWGQKPHMVTSFADGTKISFEQAIVANATGMRVAQARHARADASSRARTSTRPRTAIRHEELLRGPGIVDYVVGAVARARRLRPRRPTTHPTQQHYLNLYKLGDGPLYCFYTPYHLCHFEVPHTVARAVLFGDAAIAPLGGPLGRRRHDRQDRSRAGRRRSTRSAATDRTASARTPTSSAPSGLLPIGLAEGVQADARRRAGRGAHLRRRRAAGGPAVRPPARRAGRSLRRRPGGDRPDCRGRARRGRRMILRRVRAAADGRGR